MHNLFVDASGDKVMADSLRHMHGTIGLFETARPADRLGRDPREDIAILDAPEASDAKAVSRAPWQRVSPRCFASR